MPRTRLAALTLPALVASTLALLPGCNSDSDSPTDVPATITVSGRVMNIQRFPMAGAPVVVAGHPPTTTDATGVFTVAGVTVPYDVTVVVNSPKAGITYRGLSRPDPTLLGYLISSTPANSTTVTGTISGGAGFPQPDLRICRVTLMPADINGQAIANQSTGAFTLTPRWDGAGTITASLHALQWDRNAAGMPLTFTGYAVKTGVSISSGGTLAGQDLAMTAVTNQTISGSVTVPPGLALSIKSLEIAFGTRGTMSLGNELGAATAFTYAVPVITGTTINFTASATGSAGTGYAARMGILPGASGINMNIPGPPLLSLPVNAGTGVTTATTFSWSPVASTVYLLSLTGAADKPSYYVITATPNTTIPDLSTLGLGLPAGTAYAWTILAMGPHANIDAAAGPAGFYPTADVIYGQSPSRTLTTAP